MEMRPGKSLALWGSEIVVLEILEKQRRISSNQQIALGSKCTFLCLHCSKELYSKHNSKLSQQGVRTDAAVVKCLSSLFWPILFPFLFLLAASCLETQSM